MVSHLYCISIVQLSLFTSCLCSCMFPHNLRHSSLCQSGLFCKYFLRKGLIYLNSDRGGLCYNTTIYLDTPARCFYASLMWRIWEISFLSVPRCQERQKGLWSKCFIVSSFVKKVRAVPSINSRSPASNVITSWINFDLNITV